MSKTITPSTPFVFQISAALQRFKLQHPNEKSADLSIGTPPTSLTIRKKQLELIFGVEDNPFISDSAEFSLYNQLEYLVYNMGKYEPTGGRRSFFNSQKHWTIISGGVSKALELWGNLHSQYKDFGQLKIIKEENDCDATFLEGNDSATVFSTSLLERASLVIFLGPQEVVEAMQALHTALLGTPSAPQQDLYNILKEEHIIEFLKNGPRNSVEKNCLEDATKFLSFIYSEPLTALHQKGSDLRKTFADQFLKCFFGHLVQDNRFKIITGNGGGRQALNIVEKFLVKKKVDQMIVFEPHWTYSNVYTNTTITVSQTNQDGQPDISKLEKNILELIAHKEKHHIAVTLNSPNNPTGVLYTRETLEKLLLVCQKYGVHVVDDACYIYIVRKDQKEVSLLIEVALDLVKSGKLPNSFLDKIFTAFTASKGLGMAGARLGGILYSDDNFTVVAEESYSKESPNLMALFIANKLTQKPQPFHVLLETINQEIDQRIEKVTSILEKAKISYRRPEGAFYLEVKVPFLKETISDMKIYALEMAEKKGIAFMPMEVFDGEQFAIRLSLGGEKSLPELEEEIGILIRGMGETVSF